MTGPNHSIGSIFNGYVRKESSRNGIVAIDLEILVPQKGFIFSFMMDFCVHVKVSAAGMFIGAILVGVSFSLKVSKSKTIFHNNFFFLPFPLHHDQCSYLSPMLIREKVYCWIGYRY